MTVVAGALLVSRILPTTIALLAVVAGVALWREPQRLQRQAVKVLAFPPLGGYYISALLPGDPERRKNGRD